MQVRLLFACLGKLTMKRFGLILALAVFLLPVAAAEARVVVKERTKYYNVSGKTGAQLFKSISRRGPKVGSSRHAIASMRSDLRVRNVKPGIRGSRCVIKSADIVLNITYTYPRWNGRKSARPAVRKAWDRFMAKAIQHEKKHGQIARRHARDVDRTLRGLRGRVSRQCADFGRGAERKLQRLAQSAVRRHQRFDRREGSAFSRATRLQRALFKAR